MPPYDTTFLTNTEWDVIVIGTGMGGGVSGYKLSQAGKKVLFVEIGPNHRSFQIGGQQKENVDQKISKVKRGYWPDKLLGSTSFGDLAIYPTLGYGVGGSTLLYAAQLERFHASDFEPRKYHLGDQNHSLPEKWPITYEEILPFYKEAEMLLNVGGGKDPYQQEADQSHLLHRKIVPTDVEYIDEINKCGLNSYIAHVIEDTNNACKGCGGMLCDKLCRRDVMSLCIIPAIKHHGASLIDMCEVISLNYENGTITSINVRHSNQQKIFKGKSFVLAAGAIFTPKILLNSKSTDHPKGLGNNNGFVGKNLMWHASDFFVLRPKKSIEPATNSKLIACNDFYKYKNQKLGTFQSGGTKIKAEQLESFLSKRSTISPIFFIFKLRWLAKMASKVIEYFASKWDIYATVVEDLPYLKNRIFLDSKSPSGVSFSYNYSKELSRRNRLFKKLISKSLTQNFYLFFIPGKNNLNWGHPSGTCRFGTSSNDSVLNKNNQIHGVKNIFVVDSSFFPSSGGTNPSLTVAANAIRISSLMINHIDSAQ